MGDLHHPRVSICHPYVTYNVLPNNLVMCKLIIILLCTLFATLQLPTGDSELT